MSLDLTVLRLLKYRAKYEALARAIPRRVLDTRSQIILADFGRFFAHFPEAPRVDRGAFGVYFRMLHPRLSDEDLAVYDQLFAKVDHDIDPSLEAGLMGRLAEAATALDIATMLAKYNDGEEVDIKAEVTSFLDRYDTMTLKTVANPQVLDAIEDLLKDEEDDRGLHWRLPCLNQCIKPVVGGDFIVVAGRPDKGKTTFLTDQLTYMAPQVDKVWPGEKRSILWFNNEGTGKRIVTRAFQSALNATFEDLIKLSNTPADAQFAQYKTMVRQKYAEALGGRPGVLRIFDVHDWWNHEVEDVIKKYRPAMIVFDMVDNIRFGGEVAGERTDQKLEAMYQWARVRGVKYDCGVLATSQISADGDGMPYPTLPMLKDSKTGKQGAADVIITLGTSNEAHLANSRFIGTTKNKKRKTMAPASPMKEVMFDGARGRYVEAQ
jgi:replicative DNA helicase